MAVKTCFPLPACHQQETMMAVKLDVTWEISAFRSVRSDKENQPVLEDLTLFQNTLCSVGNIFSYSDALTIQTKLCLICLSSASRSLLLLDGDGNTVWKVQIEKFDHKRFCIASYISCTSRFKPSTLGKSGSDALTPTWFDMATTYRHNLPFKAETLSPAVMQHLNFNCES